MQEIIKKIIIDTIDGEQHLGENLKKQCLEYLENLEQENKQLKEENQELKEQLQNISNEFLKYNWKTASKEQTYNQLKSLYESIFGTKE